MHRKILEPAMRRDLRASQVRYRSPGNGVPSLGFAAHPTPRVGPGGHSGRDGVQGTTTKRSVDAAINPHPA